MGLELVFGVILLLSCYGVAFPNSGLERSLMQLAAAFWVFFHISPQFAQFAVGIFPHSCSESIYVTYMR